MQKLNLEKTFEQMLDAFASYPVDRIQIDFDDDLVDVHFVRKGDSEGADDVELEDLELYSQHRESFGLSNPELKDYFYEDHLTLRSLVELFAQRFVARHVPGWDASDGTWGH